MSNDDLQILNLFHHIHHSNGEHSVHHCGGDHIRINPKLDYEINHCSCNKHRIDKEEVIGHDFDMNEIKVIFKEKCPESGWHIESGHIIN